MHSVLPEARRIDTYQKLSRWFGRNKAKALSCCHRNWLNRSEFLCRYRSLRNCGSILVGELPARRIGNGYHRNFRAARLYAAAGASRNCGPSEGRSDIETTVKASLIFFNASLCFLCVSVVTSAFAIFTAETQRKQRRHREMLAWR